jgi:hypothetical protein
MERLLKEEADYYGICSQSFYMSSEGSLLSGENNRDNCYSDNDNHSGSAGLSQKEDADHNDNCDKPLAKLLGVDNDPDIVHVLKWSLLKTDS